MLNKLKGFNYPYSSVTSWNLITLENKIIINYYKPSVKTPLFKKSSYLNQFLKINRKIFFNFPTKKSFLRWNRLLFSTCWWTYYYDYKLNLFNKRTKLNKILFWYRSYYYNSYNFISNSLQNFNYKYLSHNLFISYKFQLYNSYKTTLFKNNYYYLILNNLLIVDLKNCLKMFIIKWKINNITNLNFILNNYKWFLNNNKIDSKIKKYKLFFVIIKISAKQKIKFYTNYFQPLKQDSNNNNNKNLTIFLLSIKFLWRYQLTINLVWVYIHIFTTTNIQLCGDYFINYIQIQLRVIFSKYEQKTFLKLILKLNKAFINIINLNKYNFYNNLILLQIIITGRWQRKRWVSPFPLHFKSGLVKLNKVKKTYKQPLFYTIYRVKQVVTRKGIIGFRIFLFFNLK